MRKLPYYLRRFLRPHTFIHNSEYPQIHSSPFLARCAGLSERAFDALLHYGASRLVLAGLGMRQLATGSQLDPQLYLLQDPGH